MVTLTANSAGRIRSGRSAQMMTVKLPSSTHDAMIELQPSTDVPMKSTTIVVPPKPRYVPRCPRRSLGPYPHRRNTGYESRGTVVIPKPKKTSSMEILVFNTVGGAQ